MVGAVMMSVMVGAMEGAMMGAMVVGTVAAVAMVGAAPARYAPRRGPRPHAGSWRAGPTWRRPPHLGARGARSPARDAGRSLGA